MRQHVPSADCCINFLSSCTLPPNTPSHSQHALALHGSALVVRAPFWCPQAIKFSYATRTASIGSTGSWILPEYNVTRLS
jgi:hypothetical protein